jgi:pyruvate/2-oxoglutarate dehydrogenase complex dihydrolipoamide acyltransferase (E2) component
LGASGGTRHAELTHIKASSALTAIMRFPHLRRQAMDIKVTGDLWASTMLPEGIVERWLISDGAPVTAGDPVAEIRIEDARHEITAPASGRLTILVAANDLIEPGTVLGRLDQVDTVHG